MLFVLTSYPHLLKSHGVSNPLICNCLDSMRTDRAPLAHLEDVARQYSRQLSYQKLDITNMAAVESVFSQIASKVRSPIRGLVACAGVSDNDPAVDFSVERFRRLTDINLVGTFTVAQAVAKEMRKANVDGSMVLVASMSGTVVNKVSGLSALFRLSILISSFAGRRYSSIQCIKGGHFTAGPVPGCGMGLSHWYAPDSCQHIITGLHQNSRHS